MRHRRLPRVDLPHSTYFLTCCTHDRQPVLCKNGVVDELIALYAGYRDRGDIRLHGYVVMPDHYHALVTLLKEPSISGLVRKVHSACGRRARRATGLMGRLWQRRFYDHVVRDDHDWYVKLAYIHNNPVARELVETAELYPWSSGAFWLKGTGEVRCDGLVW